MMKAMNHVESAEFIDDVLHGGDEAAMRLLAEAEYADKFLHAVDFVDELVLSPPGVFGSVDDSERYVDAARRVAAYLRRYKRELDKQKLARHTPLPSVEPLRYAVADASRYWFAIRDDMLPPRPEEKTAKPEQLEAALPDVDQMAGQPERAETERQAEIIRELQAALMDALDWNWLDDDKPADLYRKYYILACRQDGVEHSDQGEATPSKGLR